MARRFSVEAVFKARDSISAPVSRMQNRIGRMTRSITRGLRTTNRVVGQISASLRSGLRRGAFAATAAIASLGVSLNKVTTNADELAKQSRLLQFPIEELQEWKFAAEQSGVSTELLDKSLGAFSKRLGEAKIGTGPLAAGLNKLNPALLEQLTATESISDAFEIYIGAIRTSESATERAALANAAFSRSGLKLANIAGFNLFNPAAKGPVPILASPRRLEKAPNDLSNNSVLTPLCSAANFHSCSSSIGNCSNLDCFASSSAFVVTLFKETPSEAIAAVAAKAPRRNPDRKLADI